MAFAPPDTRAKMSPAFVGSVLLHVAVAVALIVPWPWRKPLVIRSVVPVTIVAEGPANVRPAEQAPQDQMALTEEPTPEAPPEPTPPPPAPAPPPPTPTPKPPVPKPVPAPAPKPAPPAPQQTFDFDSLQKSIARSRARNPSPPRPSPAPRGPAQAETAVNARPAVGAATALSATALNGLSSELQRRWNPNCEVEGGGTVIVRIAFRLGAGGVLVGDQTIQGVTGADPTQNRIAAERALRAVRQAAPFESLPSDLFGQSIVVTFDAKQACSTR